MTALPSTVTDNNVEISAWRLYTVLFLLNSVKAEVITNSWRKFMGLTGKGLSYVNTEREKQSKVIARYQHAL
jgi:hypothetical protein